MIDLSDYIFDEYKKGDDIEMFLVINRDMYDLLRKSDGEGFIKSFATESIGLGYDCDYHVFISVDETKHSIRNRKLKELLCR